MARPHERRFPSPDRSPLFDLTLVERSRLSLLAVCPHLAGENVSIRRGPGDRRLMARRVGRGSPVLAGERARRETDSESPSQTVRRTFQIRGCGHVTCRWRTKGCSHVLRITNDKLPERQGRGLRSPRPRRTERPKPPMNCCGLASDSRLLLHGRPSDCYRD
jgi:hypothetical protein